MIGVNAATTLSGFDWQYQAIGTLGAAVERGEVTTGDIAYGVGSGLATAAADTVTLGGYAAYQYANGMITAEDAGDRFLGLGLSALGGAGALRAAGLGNLRVGQAAAAAGRTAATAARTAGQAAASAGRAAMRAAQQLELNPGALAQLNSGTPLNLLRWKKTGNPMATIAEGYGIAAERGIARTRVRGRWRNVNEAMSARARAYQQQITGRTGQSYFVDGVKFDGIIDDVLIDAKGPGYSSFVKNGEFRSWYRGAIEFVDQAQRQLRAANGNPIRWHIAEVDAAQATRSLFADN